MARSGQTGRHPDSKPAGRAVRLKRAPGRPLHAQAEEIIRKRLLDNYWKPGAMLPSEIELARESAVRQGPVSRALNDMVAANLLTWAARRVGKEAAGPENSGR